MEKAGKFFERAAYFLLVASVASFVWRGNKVLGFGIYIPTVKLSDILIVCSFAALICALMLLIRSGRYSETFRFLKPWLKYLFFIFIFFCIGSLWAFFIGYRMLYADLGDYGRILVGFMTFFTVMVIGFRNERRIRVLALSFLSALFLMPLLFVSEVFILRHFLVVSPSSYTLLAFQTGTIPLASYLVIPSALIFAYCLKQRGWRQCVAFVVLIFMTSLMLWTGSRSGWISSFVAMTLEVIALYFWNDRDKQILKFIIVPSVIFLTSLFILPSLTRNTVLIRLFPHLKVSTTIDRSIISRAAGEVPWNIAILELPTRYFLRSNTLEFDVGFRKDRGEIWKAYLVNFLQAPLGVGPGYPYVFPEVNAQNQNVNAHSAWLEVLLMGGIGALATFMLFLGRMLKGFLAAARARQGFFSLAIFGALTGMLINITFIDAFTYRWLWVIFGLVILATDLYRPDQEQLLQPSQVL